MLSNFDYYSYICRFRCIHISIQSCTHPAYHSGPVMLLVDDEPEEKVPAKEERAPSRKGRSILPSPNKGHSNEKTNRSIDRKKSIENRIALPSVQNNKKIHFN